MELKGIKVGFVLTGSFCTFKKVIPKIKELIKQEAEVIPIMSYNSYNLDTKFGKAKDFIDEIGMHYNTDNGGELNSNDKREAHLIDNFFVGGISVLYQNGSEDGDSQKLSKVKNKSLDIVTFENWERQ